MEELLSRFLAETETGNQEDYIRRTVTGVLQHITAIDDMIAACSGREFARVSAVCLAVLRLGAYEIRFSDDVPAPVAVNEAVALAKRFDGEEATAFVNGVLDKMAKSEKE